MEELIQTIENYLKWKAKNRAIQINLEKKLLSIISKYKVNEKGGA